MAQKKGGRKSEGERERMLAATKAKKQLREAAREKLIAERAKALEGRRVEVRTAAGPMIGVVVGTVERPDGASRGGRYLKVDCGTEIVMRPRGRVRLV